MRNNKGLEIIQKLVMESHVKERHQADTHRAAQHGTLDGDITELRYIRTPEHDARFKAGETYLDTETGYIRWVPSGVDPNHARCR